MTEGTETSSMASINANLLSDTSKEQLIEMVLGLNSKITQLHEDFRKVTNLRFYHLERKVNMNSQYSRRDSLEITGIPKNINDDQLEDEVIEIFKEAKATLNRQQIRKPDIQAVHRIAKKGKVIVKIVNRKFVQSALINGRNLKESTRYGDRTKIYLNESFIPEFGFLNFVIRTAYKDKKLHKFKVRNGVNFVQKSPDDSFVEIGHDNDFNLKRKIRSRFFYLVY